MNPVHTLPPNLPKKCSNILPSTLRSYGWSLPFMFSDQNLVFLISPIYATCPAHLTFLDLRTLIRFGETIKLRSSSLCSLLQSAVTCPS
jgi:hypothetical protein